MNVELHIDELVLHGVPAHSRDAVAASLTRELGRLLTERGMPESWGAGAAVPQIQAPPVRMKPGMAPGQIGVEVARSIYGGLQR